MTIFLRQACSEDYEFALKLYGEAIRPKVLRLLREQQRGSAKSMALFVLKNNPAFGPYERHGFEVVRETHTTLMMRRALAEAA